MTAMALLILLLALGWLASRLDSAPKPSPDRHPEFPPLEFTQSEVYPPELVFNPHHQPQAPDERQARGWNPRKVRV